MEAPKVEEIVAANLTGKGLHGPWILDWVQQYHLQAGELGVVKALCMGDKTFRVPASSSTTSRQAKKLKRALCFGTFAKRFNW